MKKVDIEKRFGIALQNWRKRLRVSQEDLASRIGLHRSYLSDVEQGKRNVTLKTMEKLTDALGISVWTFFSEFNDKPGTEPLTTDELVDILLVEDDARDAELTLRALREGNIASRIYVARDGVEALDFLFATGVFAHRRPNDQPKIILLDLHLPKIDGIEVLRRVKADSRTRSIPVVVLTGSKEHSAIATTKNLGADTYIVKPVDLKSFSAATLQLSLQWILVPRNERPSLDRLETP
jgi:two-component system response regulator